MAGQQSERLLAALFWLRQKPKQGYPKRKFCECVEKQAASDGNKDELWVCIMAEPWKQHKGNIATPPEEDSSQEDTTDSGTFVASWKFNVRMETNLKYSRAEHSSQDFTNAFISILLHFEFSLFWKVSSKNMLKLNLALSLKNTVNICIVTKNDASDSISKLWLRKKNK